MLRRRLSSIGVFALAFGTLIVSAACGTEAPSADEVLSARLDELLSQDWVKNQVQPSPAASDAEFLRRISLDLTGLIPCVADVRDFLADSTPDKRRRLIEQQLSDPLYVQHFTNVWRAILLSQASAPDLRPLTPHLEAWLRRNVRDNVPYDAMVRELLTMPVGDRLTSSSTPIDQPTALAFYQANELKPENLASAASRIFLGVNLECAQCHNHPFADWKQDQFWQLAGFFAGVRRLRPDNAMAASPEDLQLHELAIPGTKRVVTASFLDGSSPAWSASVPPREAFADWVTSPENPYFAKAAVNRLWAHFFGRGIVDPLDELGGRVSPSHPELLDELARRFVASGFDIKFMIRAIANSAAYQRSSQHTHASQKDRTAFARMLSRGMSPEQLFDSLELVTGCDESQRARILTEFAYLDRPTETQTSILQALLMMNGTMTTHATTLAQSSTLGAVVDAPFLSANDKIEALFLATVSRPPTESELTRFRDYLSQADTRAEGLEDIFWVLLNSAEFLLNH
jgi:hypothetical protein